MSEWLVLGLAIFGFALGFGLMWLRFIPKMVSGIISVIATVVLAVMFWNIVGLPSVSMLDSLLAVEWLFGLVLGYVAGERISALF
jgi:hypothetical protein